MDIKYNMGFNKEKISTNPIKSLWFHICLKFSISYIKLHHLSRNIKKLLHIMFNYKLKIKIKNSNHY